MSNELDSTRREHEVRVKQLIKKLSSVSDPVLVEGLARELLSERPVGLLAELLATLGRFAQDERARMVYMGVVRLALAPQAVPQAVKEEVYSALARRGEGALVRYLLPISAARSGSGGEEVHDPVLEDMPLGMRKWKARSYDRDLLLRLSRDEDPSVIAILLNNPQVVEENVVRWASRRPCSAAVLLLVARHRKWSLRPKVQETLARNPYTPTHVAAAFMPLFTRKLLKLIAGDNALHDVVKAAAAEVLEIRESGGPAR